MQRGGHQDSSSADVPEPTSVQDEVWAEAQERGANPHSPDSPQGSEGDSGHIHLRAGPQCPATKCIAIIENHRGPVAQKKTYEKTV